MNVGLFVISKTQKQMSMKRQLDKLCTTYMKKYYTSIKRNGLFKHTKAMDESQKNYTE
jgi:hypothetical protein